MKMERSDPKRRHIKFRRRRITQKKEYKHSLSLLTNKILRLIHLLKFVTNTCGYTRIYSLSSLHCRVCIQTLCPLFL